MQRRRRFKQIQSLEQRLLEEVLRRRADAKLLPPGANRDEMISKAREAETAVHMSAWLCSSGSQPPK